MSKGKNYKKENRVLEIIIVGLFMIGIVTAFTHNVDKKIIPETNLADTPTHHIEAIKPAS